MSRFDEILDDVIGKAKIAADVAGKKTNEVVEFGKLKYKAKQTSWDIEKSYAKLGALVYESKKGDENYDDIIKLAIDELDRLNDKLDRLEEKIADFKSETRSPKDYSTSGDMDDEDKEEEVFDYSEEE